MKKCNFSLFIIFIILLILIIIPLSFIFVRAVIIDGSFNLGKSLQVIFNNENIITIRNSLLLGAGVVTVTTIVAAPLAFILSKTQLAEYKFLDLVLMIPFMTPPFISSMGWILFMQKNGLLNQLIPATKGHTNWFFSFSGLVLVMSFHIFPFMFTFLKNAMLNINSSLEEAGAVFGASFFERVRKILFPLLFGNYLIGALLVFIKTLSEYGTPATLGQRIGFYVFTTDIHRYTTIAPIDFGKSASLSSVLISICLIMWYFQNTITNRKSYKLVSGKGVKNIQIKLSPLKKILCWGYIVLLLIFSIGVPYFSVISTSLIKLRGFGLRAGNFTLQHYISLFTENTNGKDALLTSVFLAVSSATIAVILGTLIVIGIRKQKTSMKKFLEGTSLLPEMLPSIVIVIGIMLFWNSVYKVFPLYNTMGIMVLAYVILYLPFTIQYVTSSFLQINDNLIQAGKVFGASPFYILLHVTLPLLRKGMVVSWIMTFIITFRELVAASIIAPPGVLTISTFIVSEFEQGSVSVGMAMAVICILISTGILFVVKTFLAKFE